MASNEGQWLSREDTEELEAYRERGVAPPDKFDNVVLDNTRGGNVGAGYRYKTSGEKKAEDAAASEAVETASRRAKLLAKVDEQAVGANVATAGRVAVQDVDATGAATTTTSTTADGAASSGGRSR